MNSTRAEMLFALALTKTVAERSVWLDRECDGDPVLRVRLDALRAAHGQPETLLATQAESARPAIKLDLADAPDEAVGQTLSRYKLLERVSVVGSAGYMGMVGYDWAPTGVDLATHDAPQMARHATDAEGYTWPLGAQLAAETLATGREMLLATPEHALHVLEIITAAREPSAKGRRIQLESTFKWPVVS